MKNKRLDKRDLKFAERNAKKAERELGRQIAIVEQRRDAGVLKSDDNIVLARLYDSKRMATEHLIRVTATIPHFE
jgi:hypothetical protein